MHDPRFCYLPARPTPTLTLSEAPHRNAACSTGLRPRKACAAADDGANLLILPKSHTHPALPPLPTRGASDTSCPGPAAISPLSTSPPRSSRTDRPSSLLGTQQESQPIMPITSDPPPPTPPQQSNPIPPLPASSPNLPIVDKRKPPTPPHPTGQAYQW